MKKLRIKNGSKFALEFLSIFVAVISAFALNNWNENRKDANTESKILTSIADGLDKDLLDIELNVNGHKTGMEACKYFRRAFAGVEVGKDSLMNHFHNLTRDYVSIQNIAGYETLKSKGLELIKDDSLRLSIISLYEYDYNTLRKLEEEYTEMQFMANYFKEINQQLAQNFVVNEEGIIVDINIPLVIDEAERNKLLLYLWKIQTNRLFILEYYTSIEGKINELKESIAKEIDS